MPSNIPTWALARSTLLVRSHQGYFVNIFTLELPNFANFAASLVVRNNLVVARAGIILQKHEIRDF